MTNLSTLFTRRAIVSVWLVAFGVVAVSQLPMRFATALLLFVVGVVPPLIMLVLSNGPSPTVAEVLFHAQGHERSDDSSRGGSESAITS